MAMEWSPPSTSGKKSFRQRLLGHLRQAAAGFGDFVQIFGALFAVVLFFRLLHGDVADVFDVCGRAA